MSSSTAAAATSSRKAVYLDHNGFCLWAKRLERGQFIRDCSRCESRELDVSSLNVLLQCIEPTRDRLRYRSGAIPSQGMGGYPPTASHAPVCPESPTAPVPDRAGEIARLTAENDELKHQILGGKSERRHIEPPPGQLSLGTGLDGPTSSA